MSAHAEPQTRTTAERSPRSVIARLDRIDTWSLPYVFIGVIGLGFLFTFYDIFDINVSFIQTCVALKPGCSPATALDALKTPVVLNLAGYVVGTLVLSPIADRVGRRNMLMVTMAINAFDSNGYMLKVNLFLSKCSDYQNVQSLKEEMQKDPAFYRDCAAILGPNQPGITQPDPSYTGAQEQGGHKLPASADSRAKRDERYGPEGGALPIQARGAVRPSEGVAHR